MKKKITQLCILLCVCITLNTYAQLSGPNRQIGYNAYEKLSQPSMSAAFNGWLYNAYKAGDSLVVKLSKDKGRSWQHFTSLSATGASFRSPKVIVTGNGEHDMALYVAAIRISNDGSNTLFVHQYDATNGTLTGTPFLRRNTGSIKSFDIATSGYSDNYSIGLLYAISRGATDSIVFQASVDNGKSFGIYTPVAATDAHYRKVALSFGRSASASNGRYFMAWEQVQDLRQSFGNIYWTRNTSTVMSTVSVPVCLDITDPALANKVRNPVIATSATNTDNDSSSCTTVILFEHDASGNGTHTDILGMYNSRSHFTNNWTTFRLAAGDQQQEMPAICFDAVQQNFYATLYNKTAHALSLHKIGFNMPRNSWTQQASDYAEGNAKSDDPAPAITCDPLSGQAAMAWAQTDMGNTVYFNAEYNTATTRITQLKALNKGEYNKIQWSTTSEGPDGLFILERSNDGYNFHTITNIHPKGSSSVYAYEDHTPSDGRNYYRIRVKETSGLFYYTNIVVADVVYTGQNAVLYPNPTKDKVFVKLREPSGPSIVTIHDITGKTCIKTTGEGNIIIVDVSTLASGIYLMKVRNGAIEEEIKFSKAGK